MLRHAFHRALALLGVLATVSAIGAPVYVPSELEPWRFWVLQDQDFRQCPFLSNTAATNRESFRCAWPERLTLTLDAHGGTFTQRWQVAAESWVQVPGDAEHWPVDIRVDGAAAQVVVRNSVPQLQLARGDHVVSGAFRFSTRPEQLAIDSRTALLDLTLDGQRIDQPERPGGALWLGNRRSADQPQRMQVQVYRLVRDQVPASLTTLIRLRVSGAGRDELLSHALPEGFTPVSLESELPARLEPDGRLHVQARAGTWDLTLTARGSTVASKVRRPPVRGAWATEEVWSFSGDDRLRVAAAEGAESVDPKQASVPEDWQEFPAFRMTADSILTVAERTRGLSNADDNRLRLFRTLYLDFDGSGWTMLDRISGTMRRGWRLERSASSQLESAREADNSTLLVTRNPDGKGTGVEVRSPNLDLYAVSHAPARTGSLPATGWNTRFSEAAGEVIFPPGYRLLAVMGADNAPDAWFEKWGLWAVFGVLVVAVAARWIGGWTAGVLALSGLLLTYQEAPEYIWLWANVIAAVALARSAPEGRLRRYARGYRLVSFLVLGVMLLPLLLGQVRLALYPQLDTEAQRPGIQSQLIGTLTATGAVEENRAAPPVVALDLPRAVRKAAGRSDAKELQKEVTVTAQRRPGGDRNERGIEQQYAPGTVLQAGPGIPSWRYRVYTFRWSGAVEPTETVRFVYVGPVLMAAWRIGGAILLAALFLELLRPGSFGDLGRRFGGAKSASVLPVLGLVMVSVIAPQARAAATPDAAILEQLRTRLTRPPECSPTCADIASAAVAVHDQQLTVSLIVSALAPLAVPMPGAGDHWQLDSVTLDGKSALAVEREGDGTLWVPLTPGAHTVVLSGRLAVLQAIDLAFPLAPHRVSVESKGWEVTGLNDEQRLISGALELIDRRAAKQAGSALEPSRDFPVFVEVTREFNLGLNWGVRTTIERVAPQQGALRVEVPLLEGESVLSRKMETHSASDGHSLAVIGLERGEDMATWSSAVPRSEMLELTQPAATERAEVWRFIVSPQWNVAFDGLPAVLPEDTSGSSWAYEFHPRPGEKLRLRVTRPQAAPGSSVAIDEVGRRVVFGKRSSDTTLSFGYRSTQGGRHTIQLPPAARVASVQLDGKAVQLRPERGELSVGLLPGMHSVQLQWTEPDPVGLVSRPSTVDLHTPSSNVITTIVLGPDRWALFAAGSGVGPAILYWGQIVLFMVVAWLLGRWPGSPLRTHEWMLLGLGLSTLSWGVLALVALWQFALRWRQGWAGDVTRWRFNLAQILLALLTLCAVSSLVFAGIRQSLLASPDMGVMGDGSAPGTFVWFVDRTTAMLPRPAVLSVPLWVYRVLMFAWALWIAIALVRWLRLAWDAWKTNGVWHGKKAAAPVT